MLVDVFDEEVLVQREVGLRQVEFFQKLNPPAGLNAQSEGVVQEGVREVECVTRVPSDLDLGLGEAFLSEEYLADQKIRVELVGNAHK